jgi:hypothetical protein
LTDGEFKGGVSTAARSARRGVDVEDDKWFSKKAVLILRKAQEEVEWLLNRGYKIGSVIELIGGHYQLSARQRTALLRAASSSLQVEKRKLKLLPYSAAKDGGINIDGFNLIITLEVALSGGVLILGNDGTIRDLAGLRGTYRVIDKTDKALNLICRLLSELNVPYVKIFLDAPVSNSGRLKTRIYEHSLKWRLPVEVELVPNADPVLSKLERVVTSDSIILDTCKSWFNLSRKLVDDYIKDARIINLEGH